MYSVKYTAHAIKEMNKLPAEIKTKIFSAISKIKEDPYSHVKKLKTSVKTPLYSLRVGEYRVIMAIKDPVLIIQVVEAGNRSKIYQNY
ncbi:MAG: type II toxin-antitoxin system RelE/ParE family toxin [Methanosarcina mazei]|uniref:type II toxin-antitoxin system RelE family toxin n=1 Tax=Methanosarcina soligelidi TaxID=1036677 RepID=UPI00064F8014|nr:type II toxin-antitoxin system RelE/ParE family toxin [Methanosarcina soligelidi]